MSSSGQSKRCPRTLIVDDEPDAANSFALLLKSLGCDATAITDPLSAISTAKAMKPELVFLDLRMPGMDGLELARRLRASYGWQGIRIVAVTGFGSEEHRAATRQAGFDAHVVKPVDFQVLESTLHTLFPEMRWSTKPAG
jgi:CheY-like chemotaxis protein